MQPHNFTTGLTSLRRGVTSELGSHTSYIVTNLLIWQQPFFCNCSIFHDTHKKEALHLLSRGTCDVIVTTFETFRQRVDELNEFDWSVVVADDAHKLHVSFKEKNLYLGSIGTSS